MTKTVLITGTSRGLGLALSEYFLSKDFKVIGISRSISPINHSKYTHLILDIGDRQSVKSIFTTLKWQGVTIDCLINNSAVFSNNELVDTDEALIDDIIDTNVKGTIFITKNTVDLMGDGGHIFFINSVAGLEEIEGQSIYCASKYALTSFAGILGKELRSSGIRVTSIHPGGINTTLWSDSNPYPPGDVSKALDVKELVKVVDFVYNSSSCVEYKTVKLFPTSEWHQ